MNNQTVYAFIGVLLILSLFLLVSNFAQNKMFVELGNSSHYSDSACFLTQAQCISITLAPDGTFSIGQNNYTLEEISTFIDSKFQNVDTVHVFLASSVEAEHQQVMAATNNLIALQPRFKVSWLKDENGT